MRSATLASNDMAPGQSAHATDMAPDNPCDSPSPATGQNNPGIMRKFSDLPSQDEADSASVARSTSQQQFIPASAMAPSQDESAATTILSISILKQFDDLLARSQSLSDLCQLILGISPSRPMLPSNIPADFESFSHPSQELSREFELLSQKYEACFHRQVNGQSSQHKAPYEKDNKGDDVTDDNDNTE